MTVEEYIVANLTDRGMPNSGINKVLSVMKNEHPEVHWQDEREGYPRPLLVGLVTIAINGALKWIDENCPQAWYRPMFVGEVKNEVD